MAETNPDWVKKCENKPTLCPRMKGFGFAYRQDTG